MNEFSRLKKVIGEDNLSKIRNLKVLIVGLGGVGGMAIEMLARMNVGKIVVVDFDCFEESNLNRQILCNLDNVGNYKVEEAKKRVLSINQSCEVIAYNEKVDDEFFNRHNLEVDYVIDACDDVRAKVLLAKYSVNNNVKIISSCGTGNRMHPELLTISNVWKTCNDPLAKKFRQELRKSGISFKLPVVYSKETPVIKTANEVGSCCLVPNYAGILLASYVINDVLNNG